MPGDDAPINRRTLADQVYDTLRKLLLDEQLEAGETLNIDELSRRLEVSTTPIRQAMTRLRAEGLIDWTAGRQPTVSPLTMNEVETLYDIRSLIEPYILRLLADAAGRDRALVEQLESLLEELKVSLKKQEGWDVNLSLIKVDHRLGSLLLSVSTNPFLEKLLHLINNHILRLRLVSAQQSRTSRIQRFKEATEEHIHLVEAVLSGDERAIAHAVDDHLRESEDRSIQALGALEGGKTRRGPQLTDDVLQMERE